MENKRIAKLLEDVANAYEIRDVEWKPQAYRRAARSIRNHNKDILEEYEKRGKGGLEDLEGVGSSIAEHIEEYIKNGSVDEFEELFDEIPKAQSELMEIEGLGPKKIKRLRDELGIKTIEELKEAVKEGEIAGLDDFSEKTQENIRDSINRLEQSSKRHAISSVMPLCEGIISYLKRNCEIERIRYAGSLRRLKPTIGDIDILVSTNSPEKAIDTFSRMDNISKVISKGESKSSVILEDEIQVDLRVIDKKSFGAALQYFTGSKEHNIELRKIAQRKGYKLSEYGLFDESSKMVAGENEEGIYDKLDCSYIPPEMRENRGEIEFAQEDNIPKLIQLDDIKGDLHIHTKDTDGDNSIEEILDAAKKRGYEYIAISDHSKSTRVAGGLSSKELKEQGERIEKLRGKYDIEILKSSEIDILEDGSLDFDEDTLKGLDIRLSSVHSHFKLSKDKMTKRLVKALEDDNLDILTHPLSKMRGKRDAIDYDRDEVFRTAAKYKKALEINAQPDRMDLDDKSIIKAKGYGAKFVINTDSHNISQLDLMRYGVGLARRGWLTREDVINTYPFNKFKKYFKR